MHSELTTESMTRALLYFAAMLVSLTFHEAAHALIARLRGDMTATDLGRLSLNPLRHIDFFGTIVLPLAGALSQLPVIGWAKPVPVDVSRLRRPRLDHLLVAAAGPVSNLVLSAAAAIVAAHSEALPALARDFFVALMWVNAYLAFFNLLPLPPLDGGTIWGQRIGRALAPYGILILMGLIYFHGLDWLPRAAFSYISLVNWLFGRIPA